MNGFYTQRLMSSFYPYLVAVVFFGSLAGCGTTELALKPADPGISYAPYKSLAIQTTSNGAVVSDSSQARITDLVKTEILECCPKRFDSVTSDPAQPHDLLLRVKVTVYDEGNRFARLMLMGLGSMQIHAQVELIDANSGKLLSAGEAGKTFAAGGVYGAAVGIEDLERDFAQEVVKGMTDTMGLKRSKREGTERGK